MLNQNNKFIYSIVAPTILAISLFIATFYAVIIPMFERSMMDQKKETIVELTNAAWSVVAKFNDAYLNGTMSLQEAQEHAASHIGTMRYGDEQKDYFWIISSTPTMIMHPYRSDLIGQDLADFTDDHENKLFLEAAQLVRNSGSGTTEYYWQWKDDASKVVPKLSYVKGFESWDWIIGTGVYIEDVEAEIAEIQDSLWRVSLGIITITALIFFYILKQTKQIENQRQIAESDLRLALQKYKSLVEASSEGTLMIAENRVVFANAKFHQLLESSNSSILGQDFSDLFDTHWQEIESKLNKSQSTYSLEATLCHAKPGLDKVVISVSKVSKDGTNSYIVVVKTITEYERLQLDAGKLSADVELSLQMMNQPILHLVTKNVNCTLSHSITDAATIMASHQSRFACIKEKESVIGVITPTDINHRAIANGMDLNAPVHTVMTSPIKTINQNALLHEAVLLFNQKNISHLLVTNNVGTIVGNISRQHCLEMQRNSLTYLVEEINSSTLVTELQAIYNKLPLLVQAIFTSTDNINAVSRIISSIADAINNRIIELALLEMGPAPCNFAFVATGSEGRGEQTLKTDQDNAIVYEDVESGVSEDVKDYFLALGSLINENLHTVGYSRCKGDLMAGNPEWCNPLSHWQAYFEEWISRPEKQNVLDSSIFFDMKVIYGDATLITRLKEKTQLALNSNPIFFRELALASSNDALEFGEKRVNIKSLLVPVIGYLRVHALKNGIEETNSLLRLDQLIGYGLISEQKGRELEDIYKFLMHLRIKWQVQLILDNEPADNELLIKNLTAIDMASLENIVQQVSQLQVELKSGV